MYANNIHICFENCFDQLFFGWGGWVEMTFAPIFDHFFVPCFDSICSKNPQPQGDGAVVGVMNFSIQAGENLDLCIVYSTLIS